MGFGCFSWFISKSSTWLVDCWCHPCHKKDKWQGMEFVTSDISLDLFWSNQESNPTLQNMLFNMKSWLAATLALSWQPIKKWGEGGWRKETSHTIFVTLITDYRLIGFGELHSHSNGPSASEMDPLGRFSTCITNVVKMWKRKRFVDVFSITLEIGACC